MVGFGGILGFRQESLEVQARIRFLYIGSAGVLRAKTHSFRRVFKAEGWRRFEAMPPHKLQAAISMMFHGVSMTVSSEDAKAFLAQGVVFFYRMVQVPNPICVFKRRTLLHYVAKRDFFNHTVAHPSIAPAHLLIGHFLLFRIRRQQDAVSFFLQTDCEAMSGVVLGNDDTLHNAHAR